MADFLTDMPGTPSCDMNNCRCGSSKNCMYYNDGVKGHYNYVAVQGEGSVENPEYRCANKAADYYNAMGMYGDHARGGLGAYNDESLNGPVDFSNECSLGKRDMCAGSNPSGQRCPLDKPDFYGHPERLLDPERLYDDVDVGFNIGNYGLNIELRRWLLILALLMLTNYADKRGMLPVAVSGLLNTKLMGHTALMLTMYLLLGYLLLRAMGFFF